MTEQKATVVMAVCERCYCKDAIVLRRGVAVLGDPICPDCHPKTYKRALAFVKESEDGDGSTQGGSDSGKA